MADLSITASSVLPGSAARTKEGIANEAIDAGEAVRVRAADGEFELADADAAGKADAYGIALNSAAAGQAIVVQFSGTVDGIAGAAGTPYFLSATAGKIAPHGDLVTGDAVTLLGVGDGSNLILAVRAFAPAIP